MLAKGHIALRHRMAFLHATALISDARLSEGRHMKVDYLHDGRGRCHLKKPPCMSAAFVCGTAAPTPGTAR
jgi:hypothetical protein